MAKQVSRTVEMVQALIKLEVRNIDFPRAAAYALAAEISDDMFNDGATYGDIAAMVIETVCIEDVVPPAA
jgi:hypothetical protein